MVRKRRTSQIVERRLKTISFTQSHLRKGYRISFNFTYSLSICLFVCDHNKFLPVPSTSNYFIKDVNFPNSFKRFIDFCFMHMSVLPTFMSEQYMHTWCPPGSEDLLDSPKLELQIILWVLQNEPWFSERAGRALYHLATFPASLP